VCAAAPVWHAFGRLGCLLAGCCYGRPTDVRWAVAFNDPASAVPEVWRGLPLHPVQLYEAAGEAVIALALWRLVERGDGSRPGVVAAAYFAAYGVLRFLIEPYRGDSVALGAIGLTAGQGLGVLLAASAIALLTWRSACTRPS
jgi:phosphatidylglycerol:prolipoprotein diacylglycerol transferase